MRILYFSRDYTPHDYRFLAALANTEHQVFYLRLEDRGIPLEDRSLPSAIQQVHWKGGAAPARLRDGIWLLKDLRRVIQRLNPDLIHAGPLQTTGLLSALSGYQPLVSMSWAYDLLLDADKDKLWRWATRYTLNHSAVLLGDCQAVKQKAAQFGYSEDRIFIFPWGVDLQQFKPGADSGLRARLGWQNDFVLISGRAWEPIYGVDVLARAFVIAAQKCSDLRLILLGNGSEAAHLRRIFIEGDVLDRVHLGGYVSQNRLPDFYRAADLYISASHSDGSSVSLMEALASGLPSIVSDIPTNREWITPDEHGWHFPDGDAAGLAEKIIYARNQRVILSKMSQSCRRLAEQRADWSKNFQVLLKAYEVAKAAQR